MNTLEERFAQIRQHVAQAALRHGRNPADITLIAVSKTKPKSVVEQAVSLGHRAFGENRVQEAAEKFTALKKACPDLQLHLIGPLQTNKVALAVSLFDVIHTVDRPKLARTIAQEASRQARSPRLMVQVNIGLEPQKTGIEPQETASLVALCRDDLALPVEGLMCLPPVGLDPAPFFAKMQILAADLGLASLSMGMSDDFETAIAFGATHVRIGTALFGDRAAALS